MHGLVFNFIPLFYQLLGTLNIIILTLQPLYYIINIYYCHIYAADVGLTESESFLTGGGGGGRLGAVGKRLSLM